MLWFLPTKQFEEGYFMIADGINWFYYNQWVLKALTVSVSSIGWHPFIHFSSKLSHFFLSLLVQEGRPIQCSIALVGDGNILNTWPTILFHCRGHSNLSKAGHVKSKLDQSMFSIAARWDISFTLELLRAQYRFKALCSHTSTFHFSGSPY